MVQIRTFLELMAEILKIPSLVIRPPKLLICKFRVHRPTIFLITGRIEVLLSWISLSLGKNRRTFLCKIITPKRLESVTEKEFVFLVLGV